MLTSPRIHRARRARAAPAMLAPHQPSPPPEHRQVHQLDRRAVLDRHVPAATRAPAAPPASQHALATARRRRQPPRAHSHRGVRPAAHTCAYSRTPHRGSPELDDLRQPSSSQSPCLAPGMPYTPLKSEAPVFSRDSVSYIANAEAIVRSHAMRHDPGKEMAALRRPASRRALVVPRRIAAEPQPKGLRVGARPFRQDRAGEWPCSVSRPYCPSRRPLSQRPSLL
jgi:hypothetical protein